MYGRVYPGQAFKEYWTNYEALKNSVRLENNGATQAPNIPEEEPLYDSALLNSLRAPLPKDPLASSWMVVTNATNPNESGEGEVEKLVSLLNSNIHKSSALEEQAALPFFSDLFNKCDTVDLKSLKLLVTDHARCIPPEWRALSWQLLLGQIPPQKSQWQKALEQKRNDYYELVKKHFVPEKPNSTQRGQTDYIIRMDVDRTRPLGFQNLFMNPVVQQALCRVLFVWSCVHPDVEYFQGLNEIAAPIFLVYLSSCFGALSDYNEEYLKNISVKLKMKEDIAMVEADTYWSVVAVMDKLRQRHAFTAGGIHAESMLKMLTEVVHRSNPELETHLQESLRIDLIHFSFRWALCLMAREFSPRNVILLWDMYFADSDPKGFAILHVYVCAAFLKLLAEFVLQTDDMEKGLYLLQKPPTHYWDEKNILELVWTARELRAEFPLS